MTDSSTPEGTGLTEAQAAEAFEAMLTRQEEGTGKPETDTEAESEEEAPEADPEEEEQPEESDESEEQDQQPQTFRVKVDGQEIEVTQDELLKGYSRTEDYRRKTTALADQRKSLDAERQALAPEREQYKAVLDAWQAQLAAPPHTDEQLEHLRNNAPEDYLRALGDNQRAKEASDRIAAEKARVDAESQREAESKRAQAFSEAEAALKGAVPEWKDPAKYQAGLKATFDYAGTYGYTPAQVLEGDARTIKDTILILRKAAAFDALQSKKPAVQKQVSAVKTASPGSQTLPTSKASDLTRSKQRLAKTGSVHDAASIFLKMLPD
jgi:hypothetical protein